MATVDELSSSVGILVHAAPGESVHDLDREQVIEWLRSAGAIIFRGFAADENVFEDLTARFSSEFLQHGISNRPQLKEGDQYTNLANIGHFPLVLHTEMSYFPVSPELLWFHCITPASEGGETTLCDGVELLRRMDPAHAEFFSRHRIMYAYPSPTGGGFFGSFTPEQVEQRLREGDEFEYRECPTAQAMEQLDAFYPASVAQNLRSILSGRAQNYSPSEYPSVLLVKYLTAAIRTTRMSEERAFANSAVQFYPNKRFHGFIYDDEGRRLDEEMMRSLLEVADGCSYAHRWERGDLVMIDNSRMLHGRREFQDTARKIHTRMSMADFH